MEIMIIATIANNHSLMLAYDVVTLDEQIKVFSERWKQMMFGRTSSRFGKEQCVNLKKTVEALEKIKAAFDADVDPTEGEVTPKRPKTVAAKMGWGTCVYVNTVFHDPHDVLQYISPEWQKNVLSVVEINNTVSKAHEKVRQLPN